MANKIYAISLHGDIQYHQFPTLEDARNAINDLDDEEAYAAKIHSFDPVEFEAVCTIDCLAENSTEAQEIWSLINEDVFATYKPFVLEQLAQTTDNSVGRLYLDYLLVGVFQQKHLFEPHNQFELSKFFINGITVKFSDFAVMYCNDFLTRVFNTKVDITPIIKDL